MKHKLFSVPLTVLIFLNAYSNAIVSDDEENDFSAYELADVIVENFSDFVDDYNSYLEEQYELALEEKEDVKEEYDLEREEVGYSKEEYQASNNLNYADDWVPSNLHANYVEEIFAITIVTYDDEDNELSENGLFLDFDDNNGYVVVGPSYQLYELETDLESPFSDIGEYERYYIEGSGFFYLDDDGNFIDVSSDSNFDTNGSKSKSYKGQLANGCGRIYDTESYIRNRYGWFYRKISSHEIQMERYNQYNMSVYLQFDQDERDWYSEGNCWMIAGYHVLQYLADIQIMNAPLSSQNTIYYPKASEPEIYYEYFDGYGNSRYYYIRDDGVYMDLYKLNLRYNQTDFFFPELYTETRKYINDNYQKCESGTLDEDCAMIQNISYMHGLNLNYDIHSNWKSYVTKGIQEIKQDKPLIWRTSNCTYGAHQTAVCAYETYQKTHTFFLCSLFGMVTVSYTRNLYGLKDGWSSYAINSKNTIETFYFDMYSHKDEYSKIVSFDY